MHELDDIALPHEYKRTFFLIACSIYFAAFLFACPPHVAAQDGFSDDADIKAFLRDNFDGENVGMVIGLVEGVFPNTPAAQAGITAGLVVQKIDDISTANKSTDLCACYIRGTAGTKVHLQLLNPERNETSTVELTRQKFTPPKP